MNRAAHAGDYSFSVPLESIAGINYQWGFITGIVVVATDNSEFTLRCFGAKRFADTIRAAAEAVH